MVGDTPLLPGQQFGRRYRIISNPEATSEWQKCRDRRGEATAVFLDDVPSFRYYATLPYWLGRAREMQKLDARPQYQEFLRIRQAATDDPLVDDARKRLSATSG